MSYELFRIIRIEKSIILVNYLDGIGDSGFVSRKKAIFYDLKHKMKLQRVPNPQ